MRPLKLTMKAFGPYSREQVIDFSELQGRNLFLITGPTGAGKTTIFDGISYAIYGKASGNDRDGESLRSHFAEDSLPTSVELEFELKDKLYLIKRSPKQLRKRSKGEGYIDRPAEAELTIFDNGSQKVVAGVTEVRDKIAEIMGITYEQFKQIIMIPQGEFRELLTADSKDREKILQKIFGTQSYYWVQEKLGLMAKELEDSVKEIEGKQQENIHNLDVVANPQLNALIEDGCHNINAVVQEIKEALNLDSKMEEDLGRKVIEKESEAGKKQEEIFRGKENNLKLEAKVKVEDKKKKLEACQLEMEHKNSIL
ncbi:MAG: AAA family ATPase, partial [Eubacteriales bacterium]